MIKAVLFDLDNTLLGNSMDTFIPAYFGSLTRYCQDLVPPEELMDALMRGTAAMDANSTQGLTNAATFNAVFFSRLNVAETTLLPRLEQFYAMEFSKLEPLTCPIPDARPFVAWVFEQGLQVVIATNPLFPRIAIDHRLAWAGIPIDEYHYDLVTTYETMHATKARSEYYSEIVSILGREPHECLMIGDDFVRDMQPASTAGLPVYWIASPDSIPPDTQIQPLGQGLLGDAWRWLKKYMQAA